MGMKTVVSDVGKKISVDENIATTQASLKEVVGIPLICIHFGR